MTSTETDQRYMIFIQATPERIWEAITQPQHTARYFNGHPVEAVLEPGGVFNYPASATDAKLMSAGHVVEVDPRRRLVTTWRALWSDEVAGEKPGRVTWQIEPHESGAYCQVSLRHDQLEGAPITAKQVFGAGWSMILSSLKTYAETGKSLTVA